MDNDSLYQTYLKAFALVRSGATFEPRMLLGEGEGMARHDYDEREMAAIALGVKNGADKSNAILPKAEVIGRVAELCPRQ
ncbi:hypothetical protein HMI51_37395 [Corallococcus coralloides]|uniref:hypothetical protein n=1 Tax=Corallococcus sp. CA049B TaxID=2316730 RepID=UPI0011C356A5|nr:hypothetical protein [Corallococcus sp. CA049B]NOJ98590.1 hypothetical protein [Corallococcus coralloides]